MSLYAQSAYAGWYNSSWGYRKKITIDHTKVPNTNQSYFPVLVNRTDTDWKDTTNNGHAGQSDGGDFVFTSSNGTTKLDHEIEKYTPSTGELVAWVEVPVVSTSVDTDIYLYYGNASCADQWNVNGTWDEGGSNNYVGVWHLHNSASPATDSTSHGFNATQYNGVTFGASAKINSGVTQDNSDYLLTPNMTSAFTNETFTAEIWFYPTAGGVVVDEVGQASINTGWHDSHIEVLGTGEVKVRVWSLTAVSLGNATLNAWNHAVVRYDKAALNLDGFLNGTEASGNTSGDRAAPYENGYNMYYALGAVDTTNLGDGTYFDGSLDEFRVSKTARGADWIKTEYNNQSSPSTFYGVDVEETPPAPGTVTTIGAGEIGAAQIQ